MIDEFITLCQKIEKPTSPEETSVEIYTMPHQTTRQFRALTFIPDQYQSQNNLDFGQLPSKSPSPVLSKTNPFHDNGQSMLLSLAIVLCLAGLLYILIYFTSCNLIFNSFRMSEYRSFKEGANRDFRDQFNSIEEYKAAVSRLPKVPSLVPKRNVPNQRHGLNKAPSYSRYRNENPRRSHNGYNLGIYFKSNNHKLFPK